MKPLSVLFFMTTIIGCLIIGCAGEHRQKSQEKMNMKRTHFGEVDGQKIYQYTITNVEGMKVSIINYGAIITHLLTPDKTGKLADVVLGYDHLQQYLDDNSPYFGVIAGRYANRIANGQFGIDGNTYQLAVNNGPNHLHGGIKGFDKVVWTSSDFIYPDSAGVVLNYLSPDGEEGYPGNLSVKVIYTLNNNNELRIDYEASTDAPTIINLTQHSYFNLNGQNSGTIHDHLMQIFADYFIPVNESLIPTGEILPVENTPMDFRNPKEIGYSIDAVNGGFDHTFVLNDYDRTLRHVASVKSPASGRLMKVFTDQPGMQFYSGNFLDGTIIGKENTTYLKHSGFCLETQHFPDSPNQPGFPSVILRPGEKYISTTIYRFETVD